MWRIGWRNGFLYLLGAGEAPLVIIIVFYWLSLMVEGKSVQKTKIKSLRVSQLEQYLYIASLSPSHPYSLFPFPQVFENVQSQAALQTSPTTSLNSASKTIIPSSFFVGFQSLRIHVAKLCRLSPHTWLSRRRLRSMRVRHDHWIGRVQL